MRGVKNEEPAEEVVDDDEEYYKKEVGQAPVEGRLSS